MKKYLIMKPLPHRERVVLRITLEGDGQFLHLVARDIDDNRPVGFTWLGENSLVPRADLHGHRLMLIRTLALGGFPWVKIVSCPNWGIETRYIEWNDPVRGVDPVPFIKKGKKGINKEEEKR